MASRTQRPCVARPNGREFLDRQRLGYGAFGNRDVAHVFVVARLREERCDAQRLRAGVSQTHGGVTRHVNRGARLNRRFAAADHRQPDPNVREEDFVGVRVPVRGNCLAGRNVLREHHELRRAAVPTGYLENERGGEIR